MSRTNLDDVATIVFSVNGRPFNHAGAEGGDDALCVKLTSISLSPSAASIGLQQTQQFVATGHYSDGSMLNLTSAVTWTSSDTQSATITNGTSGGLATGLTGGSPTVTATLGDVFGSALLTVVGSVAANAAWETPNAHTTGSAAVSCFRSIFVPSDVTAVALTFSNRLYNLNTGVPITLPRVAIGKSDGAGGFATAPTIYTNVVVPGDGTVVTTASTPVVRGSDGKITIAFDSPGGGSGLGIAYCPQLLAGSYVAPTAASLFPTPSFTGGDSNPLFQILVGFLSARPSFFCVGDSILCGSATTPANCGYANAAWPVLGAAHDLAIATNGLPGGTLAEFADPVTNPALWDQVGSLLGASGVIQLGTNDTASSSASTMLGYFEIIAAKLRTLGVYRIIATTIAPTSAYGGAATAIRNTYNAMLTGGQSSANLVIDICPAVWDLADHNKLSAGADSGDALHLSTAGQASAAALIGAALGY